MGMFITWAIAARGRFAAGLGLRGADLITTTIFFTKYDTIVAEAEMTGADGGRLASLFGGRGGIAGRQRLKQGTSLGTSKLWEVCFSRKRLPPAARDSEVLRDDIGGVQKKRASSC